MELRKIQRPRKKQRRESGSRFPAFLSAGSPSRGLRVEPSRDCFQQSSGGFTGMAGGKLTAEFEHREPGARFPEGWRRGRGSGHVGA